MKNAIRTFDLDANRRRNKAATAPDKVGDDGMSWSAVSAAEVRGKEVSWIRLHMAQAGSSEDRRKQCHKISWQRECAGRNVSEPRASLEKDDARGDLKPPFGEG